jgi:hypothetical protein
MFRERLRDGSNWSQVATLPEVTDWQPAWEALRTATGLGVDSFATFIGDLDLHFGPAVEDQLLRPDEAPRDSDLEHLAATLQALVADPARPIQLSREMLFERLGWTDKLRFRNPHAFPVPAVYTANEAARQQLQARLDELTGGYIALVGPAGAGKSTLLASLTWPQRRVVRYYAFVPDASDPLLGFAVGPVRAARFDRVDPAALQVPQDPGMHVADRGSVAAQDDPDAAFPVEVAAQSVLHDSGRGQPRDPRGEPGPANSRTIRRPVCTYCKATDRVRIGPWGGWRPPVRRPDRRPAPGSAGRVEHGGRPHRPAA